MGDVRPLILPAPAQGAARGGAEGGGARVGQHIFLDVLPLMDASPVSMDT